MEGLRCPICKGISIVDSVCEGEMYSCPFCNYRYTVTSVRRYFLYPHYKDKEEISLQNIDLFLKELEPVQLLLIAKKSLQEIEKRETERLQKKEY